MQVWSPSPPQCKALQRPDVSGVRSDLGARYAEAAPRKPADASSRRHVLGYRAGRRPLPLRSEVCRHGSRVKCSGKIGCRVNPFVTAAFNRRAGAWWSELHRAASVRAKRATGHKGKIATRVWEKQKRGLAHLHGVISVGTPQELAWAKAYVEALRELAPQKGFGFVDGWDKIGRKFWPGDQAGAYLSSYFVRGRGRKAPITENVLAGDLPRLVVYVGRHLTQETRCTMRNLRNTRRVWAWRNGLIAKPPLVDEELLIAMCLLDRRARSPRGP